MKQWHKYILVVFLSGLFFWIGSGGIFVTYHCGDCHYKKEVVDHVGYCNDDIGLCDHGGNLQCKHCHEKKGHVQYPLSSSSHDHENGHCTYVVKYILDFQQNFSKIVIPPVEFFRTKLFADIFIPEKDDKTTITYNSFIPPWRPVNDVLSSLCVFII
jgi:hypothetical protein